MFRGPPQAVSPRISNPEIRRLNSDNPTLVHIRVLDHEVLNLACRGPSIEPTLFGILACAGLRAQEVKDLGLTWQVALGKENLETLTMPGAKLLVD